MNKLNLNLVKTLAHVRKRTTYTTLHIVAFEVNVLSENFSTHDTGGVLNIGNHGVSGLPIYNLCYV